MECEVLAIFDSLKKFRPFLYGARLVILSDNRALQWLFSRVQYKSPRLTRWALQIQSYGADILHLPGQANRPADTLSRYPTFTDSPQEEEAGVSFTMPPPRLPTKKMKDISDPEERALIGSAEFLVEGDPTIPGNITLIKYHKPMQLSQASNGKSVIFSLRTNTPELEESEDQVIWSLPEIKAAQRNDYLLKHIIKYLEKPTPLNKMMVDPNIKDL